MSSCAECGGNEKLVVDCTDCGGPLCAKCNEEEHKKPKKKDHKPKSLEKVETVATGVNPKLLLPIKTELALLIEEQTVAHTLFLERLKKLEQKLESLTTSSSPGGQSGTIGPDSQFVFISGTNSKPYNQHYLLQNKKLTMIQPKFDFLKIWNYAERMDPIFNHGQGHMCGSTYKGIAKLDTSTWEAQILNSDDWTNAVSFYDGENVWFNSSGKGLCKVSKNGRAEKFHDYIGGGNSIGVLNGFLYFIGIEGSNPRFGKLDLHSKKLTQFDISSSQPRGGLGVMKQTNKLYMMSGAIWEVNVDNGKLTKVSREDDYGSDCIVHRDQLIVRKAEFRNHPTNLGQVIAKAWIFALDPETGDTTQITREEDADLLYECQTFFSIN